MLYENRTLIKTFYVSVVSEYMLSALKNVSRKM